MCICIREGGGGLLMVLSGKYFGILVMYFEFDGCLLLDFWKFLFNFVKIEIFKFNCIGKYLRVNVLF